MKTCGMQYRRERTNFICRRIEREIIADVYLLLLVDTKKKNLQFEVYDKIPGVICKCEHNIEN